MNPMIRIIKIIMNNDNQLRIRIITILMHNNILIRMNKLLITSNNHLYRHFIVYKCKENYNDKQLWLLVFHDDDTCNEIDLETVRQLITYIKFHTYLPLSPLLPSSSRSYWVAHLVLINPSPSRSPSLCPCIACFVLLLFLFILLLLSFTCHRQSSLWLLFYRHDQAIDDN